MWQYSVILFEECSLGSHVGGKKGAGAASLPFLRFNVCLCDTTGTREITSSHWTSLILAPVTLDGIDIVDQWLMGISVVYACIHAQKRIYISSPWSPNYLDKMFAWIFCYLSEDCVLYRMQKWAILSQDHSPVLSVRGARFSGRMHRQSLKLVG